MKTNINIYEHQYKHGDKHDFNLELAKNNVRVKVDHWQACITDDLIDLVKDGRSVEAKNLLMNYLREGFNCDCPDRGCKMLRSS